MGEQQSAQEDQVTRVSSIGRGRRAAVIACVRTEFDPANPPAELPAHNGELAANWFRARSYTVADPIVVPVGDAIGPALDQVLQIDSAAAASARASAALAEPAGQQAAVPRFVITLGGTGLNPKDRTPQLTAARLDYQMPGISHAIWDKGLENTATAIMSRGIAGVRGQTFVLNVPSSRGGIKDGLAVLGTIFHLIQAQIEDVEPEEP